MRARMVQLLTAGMLLTMFWAGLGAGAAQADCVLLCPPPAEPPPEEPTPPPAPEPPPVPIPAPSDPPPGREVVPAGAERLLQLINETRADHGLRPMSHRSDVASIAIDHSMAMAEAADIWHNDEYFTAATKKRLNARTVGENVAVNSSIDDAHARLMQSAGHRANILNPAFVVAGIGVVQRDGGSYYITQDFLEPIAAATSTPAPRGKETPRGAAPGSATTASEAQPTVAPPANERREHFPNGIASIDAPVKRAQAGAGPSDPRSALVFAAVGLLTLAAISTGRWIRSHGGLRPGATCP